MPLQAGSHHSPSKPRTIGHGNIGVRDTQHTLLNEIDDFLIERRLKTVGDMTGKCLEQMDRLLSYGSVERHGLFDGFGRGLGTPHYFD
jgi:hypothetical protein